jgi:hypothetical protein
MTDLLERPEDTGEIPRTDTGMTTQNLGPYTADLPPAFRRPDAVLGLIGEFTQPGTPGPDPLPPPPPPAPSMWEYAPPVRPRRGRHRRPSRWDWLTTPLSAAVQIIRAAIR